MKKNLKMFLALCIAAVMLLGLCACGSSKTEAPVAEAETAAPAVTTAVEETAAAEPTTRVITDVLGREVEVPAVINTVDCHGSAARMMVYAGAVDKIAGLTDLERGLVEMTGASPYTYIYNDILKDKASTSSGWPKFETYYEEIMKLDADVIVYFGANVAACDEMQEKVGIPVVGIYATDFTSDDYFATLELLGELMGTQEHVAKVVTGLKGYLQDLQDRTANIPDEERPTVYAGAVSFKGYNGFDGTYADLPIFQAINAKNVVDEVEETGAMFIDLEQLSVWDPDYIFVNCEAGSLAIVEENYTANPAFYDNLSAVASGNVYTLPPYNAYASNMDIALIDAYWVGSIIYPEAFADVDINEIADEIFNLLVGSDYVETLEEVGLGFRKYTIGG